MKDTVLDPAFRVIMVKIGYTESDIRAAFKDVKQGLVK